MKKLRGLFRIIFGRTAFVVLFMAIQVAILFGAFRWLEEYMHIVYAISILFERGSHHLYFSMNPSIPALRWPGLYRFW